MSKQHVTKGIVLTRTNYAEADRIITVLTPSHGKLRLMAKGVRRPGSKLAGGIELLSVSDITFLEGKGAVNRLISSRLERHYDAITTDIDRTMLAYELMKLLHKTTEDEAEEAYFILLGQALEALNVQDISVALVEAWFLAQLLHISGHAPNLQTDISGAKLSAEARYVFSFDDVCLAPNPAGQMTADDIKFARLLFSENVPAALTRVQGAEQFARALLPLLRQMRRSYLLQ